MEITVENDRENGVNHGGEEGWGRNMEGKMEETHRRVIKMIIREQRIAAYKGYRGGGVVQVRMSYLRGVWVSRLEDGQQGHHVSSILAMERLKNDSEEYEYLREVVFKVASSSLSMRFFVALLYLQYLSGDLSVGKPTHEHYNNLHIYSSDPLDPGYVDGIPPKFKFRAVTVSFNASRVLVRLLALTMAAVCATACIKSAVQLPDEHPKCMLVFRMLTSFWEAFYQHKRTCSKNDITSLERYVGPFKVIERVGEVAYKLELPEELSRVHNTFHVSNLKKCHADEPLAVPLDGLNLDDKLHFVEEPVEIVGREVKRLKRSRIPLVKVRWNSKRGPEFTWEREDQFKKKYPHLFTKTTPSSSAAS
ncbi:hypothetical protein Tco_0891453 [Tanacetum coccineum]|uniref:Tf2-1-like SH3-like domain-containing protein n=1 Tax=Tanacetum coccineum TaxID=301880 RepID=A0ABQ5C2X7_9ASTR